MKKLTFLAVASGLAFSAVAFEKPQNVGVINGVKGAVTVSSAESIKRAVNGMPLPEGASILVSSDGAATVAMNNGCTVALKGNQHMRVDSATKCDETQAAVTNLFPAYKVAQAPIGGGLVPPPSSNQQSAAVPPAVGGNTTANNAVAIGFAGAVGLIALSSSGGSGNPVSRQ
jgi:hypothetical protein